MTIQDSLRKKAGQIMDKVDILIGYSDSRLPLKVNPAFIRDKKDIDTLIFNKFCINNLASYAYSTIGETEGKVGLVLKPCDTRSVIQLISEELFDRDKVKLIVPGCSGILDYKKIQKKAGGKRIISGEIEGDDIIINTAGGREKLKVKEYYADKCYWCDIHDNPPLYDESIENDKKLDAVSRQKYSDLESLEKMELDKLMSYWDEHFSHCIRCYACRNICPLEICSDKCIANLDVPQWQTQKINSEEGKFFQMIRVMHLAGRCTECGECERVCPKNIPLSQLMKKSTQVIEKLFEYRAGEDYKVKPPLLTFKNVEENIKEENIG